MLKRRITASLIVRDGIVVQSMNFRKYLPVGKPAIAIEFLNQWGIDEIILLDISASKKGTGPDLELIKRSSVKCQVPLTVGGGITHVDHIKDLMHCGADKIALNQSAIHNGQLITEAAKIFGDQCIVVSIDAVKSGDSYLVHDYMLGKSLRQSPAEFAKVCQDAGAGEILINSIDRDGSYLGYDCVLINTVCNAVSVPVICCGGAANANHFIKVLEETTANAVCAGNFFHFYEHSVNITKAAIKRQYEIGVETHTNYSDNPVDADVRLVKKKEQTLEEMLFIKIEKEII